MFAVSLLGKGLWWHLIFVKKWWWIWNAPFGLWRCCLQDSTKNHSLQDRAIQMKENPNPSSWSGFKSSRITSGTLSKGGEAVSSASNRKKQAGGVAVARRRGRVDNETKSSQNIDFGHAFCTKLPRKTLRWSYMICINEWKVNKKTLSDHIVWPGADLEQKYPSVTL
jgi:hypothetical protein